MPTRVEARVIRLPIPRINLFIASTALMFQTTVLFPWHNDISSQINKLQEEINRLNEENQTLYKENEEFKLNINNKKIGIKKKEENTF